MVSKRPQSWDQVDIDALIGRHVSRCVNRRPKQQGIVTDIKVINGSAHIHCAVLLYAVDGPGGQTCWQRSESNSFPLSHSPVLAAGFIGTTADCVGALFTNQFASPMRGQRPSLMNSSLVLPACAVSLNNDFSSARPRDGQSAIFLLCLPNETTSLLDSRLRRPQRHGR